MARQLKVQVSSSRQGCTMFIVRRRPIRCLVGCPEGRAGSSKGDTPIPRTIRSKSNKNKQNLQTKPSRYACKHFELRRVHCPLAKAKPSCTEVPGVTDPRASRSITRQARCFTWNIGAG